MQKFLSRIGKKSLVSKIKPPEECVKFLKTGMNLGWSGFTPAGYPKKVPIAFANYVEKNKLQGKYKFNLFIGASVGNETENRWAKLNLINSRFPYQTGPDLKKAVNSNIIKFSDMHLSKFAQHLRWGFLTKNNPLHLALIEATEILPDGSIVLATSVGVAPDILRVAEKVIIEINTSIPSLKGMHDIYPNEIPPYRNPYLIKRVDDRFVICAFNI